MNNYTSNYPELDTIAIEEVATPADVLSLLDRTSPSCFATPLHTPIAKIRASTAHLDARKSFRIYKGVANDTPYTGNGYFILLEDLPVKHAIEHKDNIRDVNDSLPSLLGLVKKNDLALPLPDTITKDKRNIRFTLKVKDDDVHLWMDTSQYNYCARKYKNLALVASDKLDVAIAIYSDNTLVGMVMPAKEKHINTRDDNLEPII